MRFYKQFVSRYDDDTMVTHNYTLRVDTILFSFSYLGMLIYTHRFGRVIISHNTCVIITVIASMHCIGGCFITK